jgi:hypothetical protein
LMIFLRKGSTQRFQHVVLIDCLVLNRQRKVVSYLV